MGADVVLLVISLFGYCGLVDADISHDAVYSTHHERNGRPIVKRRMSAAGTGGV
jgi:hypothetical protein